MFDVLFFVVWILISVCIWRLYHKIFDITYFGFNSIIKELITISVISFPITFIILGLIGGLIGAIFA